jgi:hypothetical protein
MRYWCFIVFYSCCLVIIVPAGSIGLHFTGPNHVLAMKFVMNLTAMTSWETSRQKTRFTSQIGVHMFLVRKMHGRCVFRFEETKSAAEVQKIFRTRYRKEPPSRLAVYSWHKNFVETGCSVLPGRSCVSYVCYSGTASFEAHESQRDVRLGKPVFQMLLRGGNIYT